MSGQLVRFVGKRILKESAGNHFGQEDPYFEEVPASRLYRAFGKKKQRRRKAVPPGLSENDSKVLTKVKRRAYRLDYSLFNLCGISFGWSSVIALVPFAGDAADAALAMMVINTCRQIDGGLPPRLQMMMLLNVAIDFVIGLVPFIGDIADALYKCNTRNAIILEKYLRQAGAKTLAGEGPHDNQQADMSLSEEFDKYDDDEHFPDNPPAYEGPSSSGVAERNNNRIETPARPQKVRKSDRNRGLVYGRGQQADDVERGIV